MHCHLIRKYYTKNPKCQQVAEQRRNSIIFHSSKMSSVAQRNQQQTQAQWKLFRGNQYIFYRMIVGVAQAILNDKERLLWIIYVSQRFNAERIYSWRISAEWSSERRHVIQACLETTICVHCTFSILSQLLDVSNVKNELWEMSYAYCTQTA